MDREKPTETDKNQQQWTKTDRIRQKQLKRTDTEKNRQKQKETVRTDRNGQFSQV